MCPSGQLLENQYQTVHQVKQVKNNAASNERKWLTMFLVPKLLSDFGFSPSFKFCSSYPYLFKIH